MGTWGIEESDDLGVERLDSGAISGMFCTHFLLFFFLSVFFPPVEDDHQPVVPDRLLLRLYAACGSACYFAHFVSPRFVQPSMFPEYLMLRIVDHLWALSDAFPVFFPFSSLQTSTQQTL